MSSGESASAVGGSRDQAGQSGQVRGLERWLDWFFDDFLVWALRVLFVVLIMAPALAAVGVSLTSPDPQGGSLIDSLIPAGGILDYTLHRVDSGFQLGLGSYLVRGWLLALTMVSLGQGFSIPQPFRPLWWCSWAFHAWCLGSALTCSHPYEATVTVLDTAFLNVVALVALVSLHWGRSSKQTDPALLPSMVGLSAALVGCLSLVEFFSRFETLDDGRLAGTFHQPNITAAYLAAILPWLINQGLKRSREIGVQALVLGAIAVTFLALVLTATRAAWVAGSVVLCWRWWMEGFARRGRLNVLSLMASGAISLAFLASLRWAALSWTGVALAVGILGLGAVLSGTQRRHLVAVALVVGLCLAGASAWNADHKPPANLQERTSKLAEGTDISFLARLEFWRSGLLMGWDHPLMGVGPRGYHRYYPSYQSDERWFSKFAHSAVLTCWSEVGIPGVVLLSLCAALWWNQCWKALKRFQQLPEAADSRSALLDTLAAPLILSLCGAVDVHWQFPLIPVTWAAWVGYALGQSLAEYPAPPAGVLAPPVPHEVVGTWTLRPRVVLAYLSLGSLGLLMAANLSWALAQYYSEVADLAMKQNRVEAAIQLNLSSTQLNPFQGSYYHHLGLAMLAGINKAELKVKPEAVVETARRAVRWDSHRAVHHDLLAKAYQAQGKEELARQSMATAVECDPVNYPSFYIFLADRCSREKEKTQKERLLMTCIQRFPPESFKSMFGFRSAEIDRQLSGAYLLLADLADPGRHPGVALSYYEALLRFQPGEVNARLGRVVCWVNQNRLSQAHRELLNMIHEDPRPEFVDVLKHLYEFEHLPFDPTGLPSVAPTPAPTPLPEQQKAPDSSLLTNP